MGLLFKLQSYYMRLLLIFTIRQLVELVYIKSYEPLFKFLFSLMFEECLLHWHFIREKIASTQLCNMIEEGINPTMLLYPF